MMSLETVRGCRNDGLAHSGNEDREVNVGLSGPSSYNVLLPPQRKNCTVTVTVFI